MNFDKEVKSNPMICKNCNQTYYQFWNKGQNSPFCCKRCALSYSSRSNRGETNKKVSLVLSTKAKEAYAASPRKCSYCSKDIPYERRLRKTCCKECERLLRSKSLSGNASGKRGGYRNGSGRSKSGFYDGVFMGSTYELVYYIFNRDNGFDIRRNDKSFEYEVNGKSHNYLPDFIVDGVYVEIKGYHTELVDVKLEAVRHSGNSIKIYYLEDLLHMMDFVDERYGTYHVGKTNNYHTLYQDYKPTYEFICDNCGKRFYSDRKRNTKIVYCSRKCAGRNKIRTKTDDRDKK